MYVHTRNSLTNWKNQKDMIAFSKNTKKKKEGMSRDLRDMCEISVPDEIQWLVFHSFV